jgi:hypothetical protein
MALNTESVQPDRGARAAVADANTGGVKLVPGGAVELLNLTESSAVVEGRSRLAVGATVALCLGGASPRRVPARVVRCNVSAIHRDSTMSYQLDLAFDEAVALAGTAAEGSTANQVSVSVPAPAAVAAPPVAPERPRVVEDLVNEW